MRPAGGCPRGALYYFLYFINSTYLINGYESNSTEPNQAAGSAKQSAINAAELA